MLKVFHNLEPFELLFYGGWEDEDMTKTPTGMAHYLYIEIDESDYTLLMLLMQARNFVDKLCVPYNEIHNVSFNQFIIEERIRKYEGKME